MSTAKLTPSEFLAEIQRTCGDGSLARQRASGIKDPAFAEIVRSRLEALGQPVDRAFERGSLDIAVADLAGGVSEVLSPPEQERLARCVGIGGLDHASVNAACIKRDRETFATVIYYGLMLFMHKYTKLMVAAVQPENVEYCNRDDPSALSTVDYLGYAEEVVEHYRATGELAGPTVALRGSALAAATALLRLMEGFVLSHEIAHFLCGHLDDESTLTMKDPELPSMKVFEENRHHQLEFEADATGFEILRRYARTRGVMSNPEDLAAVLNGATTILSLTGGDAATRSHPSPRERKLAVVDRFYDVDSARRVREWLDEPERGVPVGLEWLEKRQPG